MSHRGEVQTSRLSKVVLSPSLSLLWRQPEKNREATAFADPANSFHEKAALCRAAENDCYFATVNYASEGSPTTSAIVRPDGTLLSFQPYGKPGLLVADIDIAAATGLLAARYKPI